MIRNCCRVKGKLQGFTLVELVLAMLIIGIIVAVSVPQVSTSLAAMRLRQSGDVLLNDARFAQAKAMNQHQVYRIDFNPDGLGYSVSCEQNTAIVTSRRLAQGIKVESDTTPVSFFPDGTIDAATVTLTDGQHHKTLSSAYQRGMMMAIDD